MKGTIYKSNIYKNQLLDIYDEFVDLLPKPVSEGYIKTKYGNTHYLSIGPENGEVIISFHGGNSISPHSLLPLTELSKKYKIISPDIIGQPGKSDENRLNTNTLQYGEWASEFIQNLGYNHVFCIGGSYGGGVLIHMASINPELIKKAVFYIPTGFVKSNTFDNLKIFGPTLLKYYLNKTDDNLLNIIKPLVSDTNLITDLEKKLFKVIFNGLKIATNMPRPIKKKELSAFNSPCMIVVAEHDVMCPAKKVLNRARNLNLNIQEEVFLNDRPHMIISYKDTMMQLGSKVDSFLS